MATLSVMTQILYSFLLVCSSHPGPVYQINGNNNKGEDMAWGTSYSYDRYLCFFN